MIVAMLSSGCANSTDWRYFGAALAGGSIGSAVAGASLVTGDLIVEDKLGGSVNKVPAVIAFSSAGVFAIVSIAAFKYADKLDSREAETSTTSAALIRAPTRDELKDDVPRRNSEGID